MGKKKLSSLVPTNWLDPLLTGPDRVIEGPPYHGRDIENLLRAVRDRIRFVEDRRAKKAGAKES